MDAAVAAMWARPLTATIVAGVFALVLQFLYKGYRQRAYFRNLPGPPHSWVLGHLKVMGEIAALMPPNCHPQAYYTEIARRYNLNGIFYIDLWPIGPASVILSDPDLLEQVTTVKPLYNMHPMADDFMAAVVGRGLIATSNGAVWKNLHRAMAPAFSWGHIRSLTDLIVDECAVFRATLGGLAASGTLFSLEDAAAKLVFDIITRMVFAFPLSAQTTDSQELRDLHELVDLVEGEANIAIKYNPVEQARRWWRRKQLFSRLHPFLISNIKERFELLVREEMVPSRKNPHSILDLMLRDYVQSKGGEAKKFATASLSEAEIQMLLTNVKGLLLGGHGTTTDAICYATMLLSRNPDVVEKMRQEHISEFGSDFKTAIDVLLESPEKLQNLPYTDAVIRESLRLFPVGFGVREAAAPGQTLDFDGRRLPIDNGLAICLNGHDLHYDERFFPDPTAFRPERWLGEEEIPKSYFRTFGRGPRACLGQNLAFNEIKIILMMAWRDFDFECPTHVPNAQRRVVHTDLDTVYGDNVFQELGIEAKPRGKMMVLVKRRS